MHRETFIGAPNGSLHKSHEHEIAAGRSGAAVPLPPQTVIKRANQRPLDRDDPRPLPSRTRFDIRARNDMPMRSPIGAAKRPRRISEMQIRQTRTERLTDGNRARYMTPGKSRSRHPARTDEPAELLGLGVINARATRHGNAMQRPRHRAQHPIPSRRTCTG